ncbi:hypothetical protein QR721_03860 [Aciduricibacillus chroicocephali]|uniref:Uncharacterized protein n=1 Tax=Aciduricibacillus chroicocephali TaxID=3054939 RepID=A0ABY9KX67_9BACI|nr:hypothetical protein QR721_03860 [Bacillaceae bacterium 44XB]
MRKYVYFTITFIAVFIALQFLTGVALMALYKPDLSYSYIGSSSGIIQQPDMFPALVTAILALVITFGAAKIFSKYRTTA